MASRLSIVSAGDPSGYSSGYLDGLHDGEKWATTRLFWLGIGAGVLLSAAVLLITLWSLQ